MNKNIKERVLKEANYMIKTKDTIRDVAQNFNVSKSTVYTDLTSRLETVDKLLTKEINKIFKEHDDCKHIRGGQATKEKFKRG